MRIRTIKPEFWKSTVLGALKRDVRLCFIGLWNYCDDDGRGVDDPRLVKAELFPLDNDVRASVVDGWLTSLVGAGLLCRYEVAGRKYLSINTFAEHQRINRPSPSRIPPPDEVSPHGVLTEPSPPYAGREGKGKEGKGKEGSEGGETPTPPPDDFLCSVPAEYLPDFRAVLRASHAPDALLAELKAIHEGMHGPATPLDAIGRALRDLRMKGGTITGRGVRAFVRGQQQEQPTGNQGLMADPETIAYRKRIQEITARG